MNVTRALGGLSLILPALLLLVAPRFTSRDGSVQPHGGVIQAEARLFLVHYTSERSLLERIYDPRTTELGDYRGRELSNLVDLADARWVDATIRRGSPSFLPISWTLGVTFMVALVLWKAPRLFPRCGVAGTASLLALFLAHPAVFLNARVYQKAAKLPTAAVLVAYAYFVWESVARPRAGAARAGLAARAFAFCAVLSLLDEQGAYLGLAVPLCALVASLAAGRERLAETASVLAGSAAAVAATRAYVHLVAPRIVHAVNGYWPDFGYLRFEDAAPLSLEHFSLAASFLADQASFLMGDLGRGTSLALLGAGVAVAAGIGPGGARRRPSLAVLGLVASLVLLTVLMFAVMIQRHPPVAQEDVRRGYYGLPTLALLLLAGPLVLDRAAAALGRRRAPFLFAAIFGLAASNVAFLPWHACVAVSNHLRRSVVESPALLEILRSRRFAPVEPQYDRQTNVMLWHYAAVLGNSTAGSATAAVGSETPPR